MSKTNEKLIGELDYVHTEWGDTVHVADVLKLLTQQSTEAYQRGVAAIEDIIKMADELEHKCNEDYDKGTLQWKHFKGFRNAIRDKYLTPLSDQEDKE